MLATRTCIGAGELLAETRKSPEALREQVTTPGGTTERALNIMGQAGVKETLVEAIRAAAERSRELGK
jgi:pyrroline-5-carboxylate reductase